MLNVLIVKDRVSRNDVLNYFDWKKFGISKLITTDDIGEIDFKNLDDIDFVIVNTELMSKEEFGLLRQISEKKLNDRLVLLGEEKNTRTFTYIISNGILCYQPDENKVEKTIEELFENKIAEKKRESSFLLQLHDGMLVKKVRQALDKGDSRSLLKIISFGTKNLPAPLLQIKEYYSLILRTVFEFAEEKGVRHIDKKEIITELIGFNDYESVKECAIKKINSIIHMVEVDKNNQSKMVVEYIKDYIDENYMKQDTNAGNIAERFGISGSYIGMLFREQQKTTITKYITQLRINKAAELLSKTKLQIQVISKNVGYSDQNYFARIFKKQTGLSPGEYRNKCSH